MVLIEYEGCRILTDPWFEMNMRGLPVFRAPGIPLEKLPKLDVLMASHLHRDHFDSVAARKLLHPDMQIIGTVGTAAHCQSLGARVVDMAPWDEHTVGPYKITATPAEHTGPPPPEVNFMVDAGPWRIFFGGDAKWSTAFRSIADRFDRIDVAILPIGGTLIFGHRTTMAPLDAVRACNYLRPTWAIPIHEGGEWLPVPPASWHPGRNRHFVKGLSESGLPVQPCVLKPGETARFETDQVSKRPYAS
ncbi:MAG: L-ascorbate metabolism protein UlaG (beta-lactamase superfamily) [Myxococcota bacterium]|jgi:L-ascorbate metabolism protein UlaG (beta-lactamase superfamily)